MTNYTVDEKNRGDGVQRELSDLLFRRADVSGDSYTQDDGAAEVLGLLRRPAQPTEALRRAVSRSR